jgi:hypothetical protein
MSTEQDDTTTVDHRGDDQERPRQESQPSRTGGNDREGREGTDARHHHRADATDVDRDAVAERKHREAHQPHPHEGHEAEGIGSAGGPPFSDRPANQPHEHQEEESKHHGHRSSRVHPQRDDNQTPYQAL